MRWAQGVRARLALCRRDARREAHVHPPHLQDVSTQAGQQQGVCEPDSETCQPLCGVDTCSHSPSSSGLARMASSATQDRTKHCGKVRQAETGCCSLAC